MKERPILFSTQMVKAILDRRKNQTRRVINPQPVWVADPNVPFKSEDADPKGIINCPYGEPGDILYVKETFAVLGWWEGDVPVHTIGDDDVIYFQEFPNFNWVGGDGFKEYRKDGTERSHWKPSIFMPKKFARIWLKVKNRWAERLQDISEEDAKAEGLITDSNDPCEPTSRSQFFTLWDITNSKPRANGRDISCKANPWVWAIEFERTKHHG